MLPDVLQDRLVHLVARDPHRRAEDDAGERDHRDLRGAAADIHDQIAAGLLDRQPGADRGRDRLFHEVHLTRAGVPRRITYRPSLDLSDPGRYSDHDLRLDHSTEPPLRPRDEVAQHLLGHLEVRDDPVLQRLDDADLRGGAADHRLRLVPHGEDRVVVLVIDTIEGSLTTMPSPLTNTNVFDVPRSIATSLENLCKNIGAPRQYSRARDAAESANRVGGGPRQSEEISTGPEPRGATRV